MRNSIKSGLAPIPVQIGFRPGSVANRLSLAWFQSGDGLVTNQLNIPVMHSNFGGARDGNINPFYRSHLMACGTSGQSNGRALNEARSNKPVDATARSSLVESTSTAPTHHL